MLGVFTLLVGSALATGTAFAYQLLAPSPTGATITTDKADYAAGEQVILTGAGWADTEAVHIVVNDTIGQTWQHVADVTAGTDGSFGYSFNLPTHFVSDYDVTATGPISGTATTTFTDAPASADLDQCGNGPFSAPQGCDTSDDWQNGNLNSNQAHFLEGDFVPYRYKLDNLATGGSPHSIVIAWDTTDGGNHGLDYIGTYNATEATANPCAGVLSPCPAADTEPIPADPFVTNGPDGTPGTGDDITQVPGVFTLFGGTITSVSCPTSIGLTCSGGSSYALETGTYTSGVGYSTHTITAIQVNFTANISDPILAIGGHISVRLEWDPEPTAALISGSPYHMRLVDIDGRGGNQDRSLSAGAVIQPGKVTIVKNSVGGDDTFDYTGTGADIDASFSIATSGGTGSQTFSPITTFGTKTVTESTPPSGWTFTSLDCDVNFAGASPGSTATPSSSTNATTTSTIELTEGGDVTCTYTNTKQATVVVKKVMVGGTDTFSYSGTPSGSISTNNGTIQAAVAAGSYTSTETVPTGWDLSSIVCDDGNSTGNVGTATATFNVEAGETVTCTFTNTKRGTIVVEKQTVPDGDPATFNFDGPGGFDPVLGDGGTDSLSVAPGQHMVSETVPTGWDLTSISCSDPTQDSAGSGVTATYNVAAGETVTCTFTNTKRGRIEIEKQTLPNGDPATFEFTGDVSGTLGDGDSAGENVAPGSYSSTETVPAGWDLTSIVCDDANSSGDLGTATATFNVEAGETVRCTFTDTKRGRIIVEKQTDPDGAAGSFTFTGDAAGTISDNGQIVVSNLAVGTYTSTEDDPTPAFDLTDITCDDGNSTGNLGTRTATFNLDPGETVTCTFTNTERAMVTVFKSTNGAVDPTKSIQFQLFNGPNEGQGSAFLSNPLQTRNTFGDADGVLEFDKVPPGSYTICENPVPAGFTAFWWIDANGNSAFDNGETVITPYNPHGSDVPSQNLGVDCDDFTLAAGETLKLGVDNSRPGGEPRTIGYWKNWNRCTGGNQDDVADANGGPAAGFFLVEDLLPQLIGDFNVTTCEQAVRILSKQDQAGRNKASDAAYELAAQLLAAKLNLAAGAETCQAVVDAEMSAQNLLANNPINFTGSGNYLGPKVKGSLAVLRQQALSLANTLDQYNNGNLC